MVDGACKISSINQSINQIVAYAVVSNEMGDTVTKLLEVFVSHNIAVKEKIETVMIDKDFAEMKAIKAVLPGANILICKFHVLRAIQRAMKDFSSTERDSVLAIIRKMMMCSSEEQYIELQIELQMDSPRFMVYFIKNWDTCKESWAGHFVRQHITFGNLTNNFVESHNKKIKFVVGSDTSIPDMFENLIKLDEQKR